MEIERICFPPNEACIKEMMFDRVAKVPEMLLVAVDKQTGKIAGFLSGRGANEPCFRDEFFSDADLHNPSGKTVMLLGLDVLPEYRRQGLARDLERQYLRRERENGRKMHPDMPAIKSKNVSKMGFADKGIANSSRGGKKWLEMGHVVNME